MHQQHKNLQGSVLVFTLLVLSLLLSVTLSAAGVVVTEKNSSSATQKSALAFQVADGAAENVLKRIYKDTDPTLGSMATALTPVLDRELDGQMPTHYIPQCVDGTISVTRLPDLDAGRYSVSFFDANSQPLECSGPGYDTNAEWRTKVARIVSVGTYNGVTRAIDTTIRPAPCGGVATVVDTRGTSVTYDTIEIGNQCWMQQNMRVGSPINSSTPQADTGTLEKYCYNNVPGNCTADHGGLYSWDEAMQYDSDEGSQGICPTDWHIPTDDEWYELENFVDPSTLIPTETGYPGSASDNGWSRGTSGGTALKTGGSSGFSGYLSGYRDSSGLFVARNDGQNSTTIWWSSSDAVSGLGRAVRQNQNTIARLDATDPDDAFSVRCIKD